MTHDELWNLLHRKVFEFIEINKRKSSRHEMPERNHWNKLGHRQKSIVLGN